MKFWISAWLPLVDEFELNMPSYGWSFTAGDKVEKSKKRGTIF